MASIDHAIAQDKNDQCQISHSEVVNEDCLEHLVRDVVDEAGHVICGGGDSISDGSTLVSLEDSASPDSERNKLKQDDVIEGNEKFREPEHTKTDSIKEEEKHPTTAKVAPDTILSLGRELDQLSISSTSSRSGLGLGELKGGKAIERNYSQLHSRRRFLADRPRPPSWHAMSRGPQAIIDESIQQILKFTEDSTNEEPLSDSGRAAKFKVFLDANKEIVRTWHMLDDELVRGREGVALGERVDCIHAILVGWNKDAEMHGSWVQQAMELTELGLLFSADWESLTGRKLNLLARKESLEDVKEVDVVHENMEYIAPEAILGEDNRTKNRDNSPSKSGKSLILSIVRLDNDIGHSYYVQNNGF